MTKEPCVFIVGAGPGDPGLITVRGQRCLESADVVIYDHQVHHRLLRLAPPEAEKIDVGPAAPRPTFDEVTLAAPPAAFRESDRQDGFFSPLRKPLFNLDF